MHHYRRGCASIVTKLDKTKRKKLYVSVEYLVSTRNCPGWMRAHNPSLVALLYFVQHAEKCSLVVQGVGVVLMMLANRATNGRLKSKENLHMYVHVWTINKWNGVFPLQTLGFLVIKVSFRKTTYTAIHMKREGKVQNDHISITLIIPV